MITKCFGIISWLPDEEPARQQRKDRINRLISQIERFWPNIDILIIAQNWKDFNCQAVSNKLVIRKYTEGLGIVKARKTLFEEFLKLSYDYIILFDDDAIIKETVQNGAKKFIGCIDSAASGFGFLQYKAAQLNGCAISRQIIEKEPMVDVNPQKNEAYEDTVYSNLLHYKYSNLEFKLDGIICTQFRNKTETAPSTWARGTHDWSTLGYNTGKIVDFIKTNHNFPKNWRSFCRESTIGLTKGKKTFIGLDYFGL